MRNIMGGVEWRDPEAFFRVGEEGNIRPKILRPGETNSNSTKRYHLRGE